MFSQGCALLYNALLCPITLNVGRCNYFRLVWCWGTSILCLVSFLLLCNITLHYRLLIKVAFGNLCQPSCCVFWHLWLCSCFHSWDFFCKIFESVILRTMTIAALVIFVTPSISCIKKNLNVDKNNRGNVDITRVSSNCKTVSAALEMVFACLKVNWGESQGDPYVRRKRNSVKIIHCEINQPVRVFQTSYSVDAIMAFNVVYKKEWVWSFIWRK